MDSIRPKTRAEVVKQLGLKGVANEEQLALLDALHAAQNTLYAAIMELGIQRGRDRENREKWDVAIPMARLREVEGAQQHLSVDVETDWEREELVISLVLARTEGIDDPRG